MGATTTQDAKSGGYTLVVRSLGTMSKALSLPLRLSEPEPDEECGIVLEHIADYRLSFLPPDEAGKSPMESQPKLTKASLPCGHGFNAMALLYHFAKNAMTCPCCRAGHAGVTMGQQSIPAHVRQAFMAQLEKGREEDSREQQWNDTLLAAAILEQEVSFEVNMPLTHVILILHAYQSLDSTDSILALELPLTSSLNQDTLAFVSSGYCLRQLALNIRFLPIDVCAFELVLVVRNMLDADMPLFRTRRFESPPDSRLSVGARLDAGSTRVANSMVVDVQTTSLRNVFSSIEWSVSRQNFSQMLLEAAGTLLSPASV